MELSLLKRVIEAILLAAAQPLSLAQLAALFTEEENVDHEQLLAALQSLTEDCAERGIELKEVASGYRYQIREDVHPWVTRLWTERQTKYSRALLETLALIAYRQPITRAEIEQIRGVAVSTSMVKTLEEREWIRVVGYRDVPGRPALFGTSRLFLDYFNLKSLDELPPLAEVRDLDDYDPQLDLAPVAPPRSLELPPDDDETAAAGADDKPADVLAADDAPADALMPATPGETPVDADDATPQTDAADSTGMTDAVGDATAAYARTDTTVADAAVGDDTGTDDLPIDGLGTATGDTAATDISSDLPPDDDDVDPHDTTTSDDVPEHTA